MTNKQKRPLGNSGNQESPSILRFFKPVGQLKEGGKDADVKPPDGSKMYSNNEQDVVKEAVSEVIHKAAEEAEESEPPKKKKIFEVAAGPSTLKGDFKSRAIAGLHDPVWLQRLEGELNKKYMIDLFSKLDDEVRRNAVIYPPINLIFNAFNLTPFNKIRVVIIGQDPYHNPGQAHGLSFSVPMGVTPPPSLKNIYKELAKEYPGFVPPTHGSLVGWAKQGVFMLNASLTVRKNEANSHSSFGWQQFTDAVIKIISQKSNGVVFLLWGNFAQKKAALIDSKKHAIIKSAHPSPLSYRLFENCKCFTKVNEQLERLGREPIDWTKL